MTDITQNPGYKLREEFIKIVPFIDRNSTYINAIDKILIGEGAFAKLAYFSSLNYLVRRLITSAEFIKRQYSQDSYPPEKWMNELRYFLRNNVKVPSIAIEVLHELLVECIKHRAQELSSGKKNAILKRAQERNYGCYICGKTLIFDRKLVTNADHPDLAEVEHIWPKSLGGSNELFNLEVACLKCNKHKQDYIDEFDFHFEGIALISDANTDEFKSEFKYSYRVAIWLKDKPECHFCGRLALHQNILEITRKEKNDSWHYLNMYTVCGNHFRN